ncbi:MAG: hypothetical protein OMM_14246 [Candidatus Magnetoglobus multicellularis str. Araruama]|uniref:Uncharacterized protein n=1 Tax=Candidatus Magnetoglobus multicellularis str. Araruama TaxID=890399 RepID=A0A1V1NS65_9BACT|nr:MAG: hypothetical protein OMM_14246 [Candidatus Magnetoglobus multicellularis str. Araruama]
MLIANANTPDVTHNLMLASDTLRFQGYCESDISIFSPGIHPPTQSKIFQTLDSWINASDLEQAVLYFTGVASQKGYTLNETERLGTEFI